MKTTNKPTAKLTLNKATLKNLQTLTVRSGVKTGAGSQVKTCGMQCRPAGPPV